MNTAVAVFSALSPERVLEAVECGLRCRCTGLLRPLPSYINRVYTVELETGETVVAKFYRPGRWTRAAIIAEHDLVLACAADEIPVIAPLPLADNKGTVGDADGIAFALYPRRGGRLIEPLRAMRMIYYLAWCARQAHDASFRQNHPDWGTRAFWVSELAELEAQLGVIGQDVAHSCHIDREGQ
ncbi:MAG TPA: hypothetical protein PK770_05125 [Kiritimatiellia bacterium]|nr:hypothetical protein [Kiritimatiellia bacterium]